MEVSSARYQSMSSHPRELEEVFDGCPKVQQPEKKSRPHPEKALKCPRCDSTNTKFCYYNNYSLSQPRYFCKGCRRYWTQGGSLRNVPVGGGCRKNKRSTNSSSKKAHEQALTTNSNQLLPTLPYDPSDLTRAFVRLHSQPTTRQLGFDHHDPYLPANPNPNYQPNTNIPTEPGFLDIVRNGFLTTTNPSGFHNFYYGFGGPGSVEEVEGGVGGQEVVLPVEQGLDGATTAASTPITTSTTQGSSKLVAGGESKVMMGLQWQLGGDGTIAVDSGRDLWTGVNSNWHGLIHSSLL